MKGLGLTKFTIKTKKSISIPSLANHIPISGFPFHYLGKIRTGKSSLKFDNVKSLVNGEGSMLKHIRNQSGFVNQISSTQIQERIINNTSTNLL